MSEDICHNIEIASKTTQSKSKYVWKWEEACNVIISAMLWVLPCQINIHFVHIKNSWYGVAAFIIFSNSSKVRPRGIHNLDFFFYKLKGNQWKRNLIHPLFDFLESLYFFFFTTVGFEKKTCYLVMLILGQYHARFRKKRGGGSGTSMENEKKKQSKKCLEHVWLNINDSLSLNCWLLFNILPIVI